MNEMVQEMYAAETAEVREQVEVHRLKVKEGGDDQSSDETQNKRYQR